MCPSPAKKLGYNTSTMADDPELKQLKQIKKELEEIKDRTANPSLSFLNGILYGAGGLIGGIIAIGLLGWLLSLLGVVPGFGWFVEYLQSLVAELPH